MKLIRKYSLLLWIAVLFWAIFGIPAIPVYLNLPPPETALTHFPAKILRVSDRPPNLEVMLDNGERRNLRFPTPLYSIFMSKTRFVGLSDEQEARLTGCNAEIFGANLKYVWPSKFRVWKIDCKSQPVSYSTIVTDFLVMTDRYSTAPWFGGFVASFFIILTFVQARKKK